MQLKQILVSLLLLTSFVAVGQPTVYYYRIYLRDKPHAAQDLAHPERYLSDRALQRRMRQHLSIDTTDVPVSSTYLSQMQAVGAQLLHTSKWNNTALVKGDSVLPDRLNRFTFVRKIRCVGIVDDLQLPSEEAERRKEVVNNLPHCEGDYGAAVNQVRMLKTDTLHRLGYRGKGIQIAIMDAGFRNVDRMKMFKNLSVIGTRNFTEYGYSVYDGHEHGTMVLSCMAANRKDVLVGTAPEASYWLLRTEVSQNEQPVEEDFWAAAAEFADSVGVDIINSSLGYFRFDNPNDNYTYRQLDGHTSLMSHSAYMATRKGILVVCSAGNTGADRWKKITPPADADGVIAVGAVAWDRLNTEFSSVGNTADGRIKPDIMTAGEDVAVINATGSVGHNSGTSFASPIACGSMACLWQACPWLTAAQLREIILTSSDRWNVPDNIMGYGIPDFGKALIKGNTYKPDMK